MTATAPAPAAAAPQEQHRVSVVSWKVPITFGVFTVLLAVIYAFAPRDGETTFRLAVGTDFFALPDLVLPAQATAWATIVVMALATGASVGMTLMRRKTPLWLVIIYTVAVLVGFLAWAAAGGTVPMVGLLGGALGLAVPIIFGALGGVIGERVGVVNIAIEGQLLAGAFSAAVVSSITGVPIAGMVAAMVAGMLVALVLSVFAITYYVNQVIVGVVLNVLVIGVTSFLFSQVLAPNTALLNSPTRFQTLPIPLLGDIPLIGPIFFRQTLVVYIMYIAVFLVWWGMFRTKWGLRLRAVGEHPQAADTVGIKVAATRYSNMLLAGAIAGIGGSFFTLVSVPAFNREMTAGAGFIALAAVIFGKWDPIRATLAALLFGFASNLQGILGVIGSPVPSQFMLMLPYLVTIFAVAGLVGRSRPPAASGIPYEKQ